jgi:hypothetical protein
MTRSLFEALPRAADLRDGVLDLAADRHFNSQRNRRPLPPYPEAEWARRTEVCRTVSAGRAGPAELRYNDVCTTVGDCISSAGTSHYRFRRRLSTCQIA